MTGFIYVITNDINGKQYVGKTTDNIETRFRKHLEEYDRPRCEKRPLYVILVKRQNYNEKLHMDLYGKIQNKISAQTATINNIVAIKLIEGQTIKCRVMHHWCSGNIFAFQANVASSNLVWCSSWEAQNPGNFSPEIASKGEVGK